jgi:hypothetical protein
MLNPAMGRRLGEEWWKGMWKNTELKLFFPSLRVTLHRFDHLLSLEKGKARLE